MTTNRTDNWQGMNWIHPTTRLAIYLRDGLCCVYCGTTLEQGAVLSLDHCKPASKNGGNKPSNLVTACMKCNTSRGNRSIAEFAEAVSEYTGEKYDTIMKRVANSRKRKLPREQARDIIKQRGTVSAALQGRN